MTPRVICAVQTSPPNAVGLNMSSVLESTETKAWGIQHRGERWDIWRSQGKREERCHISPARRAWFKEPKPGGGEGRWHLPFQAQLSPPVFLSGALL